MRRVVCLRWEAEKEKNRMTTKEFENSIIHEIQTRISTFTHDIRELEMYRNRCAAVVTEYNGRQIFEMLQNMDDQMERLPMGEGRCQIEFDKVVRKLVFKNIGDPFTADGIMSIMLPDVSPKKKMGNATIGNKGLGFRSLLNWSPERIVIRSAGLQFVFSEEAIIEVLEENHATELINVHKSAEGSKKLSILTFPRIEPWQEPAAWTTEIELQIADSNDGDAALASIERELKEFNSELLLFLPRLCEVDIKICQPGFSNTLSTYYRATAWKASWTEILNDDKIKERTISKFEGKDRVFTTEWLAFHAEGELENVRLENDESPRYKLAIAIPRDSGKRSLFDCLYNYLPLRHVSVNLPCLVHATVKLDSTRDVLVIHDANQQIFSKFLPDAFRIFAEALKKKVVIDDPWLAYRLLTPPAGCGKRDYIEIMYDALRKIRNEGKYCPCVDGQYRSVADCRYYRSQDGADVTTFLNEHKSLLGMYALAPVPDEVEDNPCTPQELISSINKNYVAAKLDDAGSAELIYLLWNISRKSPGQHLSGFKLLWNEDHSHLIDDAARKYSPRGCANQQAEKFSPPDYLPLVFVSESQWNAILARFKPKEMFPSEQNEVRALCYNDAFKEVVGIHYYDKAEVTRQMISECRRILNEDVSVAEKRVCVTQLLRALLQGYNPNDKRDRFRREAIPLCVHDDGSISFANEFLFAGVKDLYHSKLPDDVFLTADQIAHMFEGFKDLMDGKTPEGFLRYIGVRSDVRIHYVDINSEEDPYIIFLTNLSKGGLDGKGRLDKKLSDVPEILSKDVGVLRALPPESLLSIIRIGGENSFLDLILAPMQEIMWKPRVRGQIYAHPYRVEWNYIAYQLNGTLSSLIFEESDRTLENAGLCCADRAGSRGGISNVLEKLGAHRKLLDLASGSIYAVLQSVARSGVKPTKEFYKKINAALGERELLGERLAPPSDLMLYAQDMDGAHGGYYRAGDICYHDNPSHARMLSKNCKMLYMGARVGADNVARRFGVRKIDEGRIEDIDFEPASEVVQAEFDADWLSKRTCMIAILRHHRDMKNKSSTDGEDAITSVKIVLVSKMSYRYGKDAPKTDVGLYEYLRAKKGGVTGDVRNLFYLNVGDVQDVADLKIGQLESLHLCRSVAGILCDVVDLSDEALENRFRSCYYDVDLMKAELQEEESLDVNGDLPPQSERDRYVDLLNGIEAQTRQLFQSFIKPSVWEYLNAHKEKQQYFRAYCSAYDEFCERALEGGGLLSDYCQKHRFDIIQNTDLKKYVEELIKTKSWSGKLGAIELKWTERARVEAIQVPTLVSYYPNLRADVERTNNEAIWSLMFFEGNKELIEKLLSEWGSAQKKRDATVSTVHPVCSLTRVKGRIVIGEAVGHDAKVKRQRTVKAGIGKAAMDDVIERQKAKGDDAEDKVVKWLKQQVGVTDVVRKSGSGDEVDRNDSCHYDISFCRGGEIFYVEVKSCEGGVFHISADEYQFAKEHPKQYQLALVFSPTEFDLIERDVVTKITNARRATDWVVPISTIRSDKAAE